MIDGGDHDIANTHTKDILSIINNIWYNLIRWDNEKT
jgi:hypothetical protein